MATNAHDSLGDFEALPLKKKKYSLIGLISFPIHLYYSVQLHIQMAILWRFPVLLLNLILLQARSCYCVCTKHKYTPCVRMAFPV